MRLPLTGSKTTLNMAIDIIPMYNAVPDYVDFTSSKDQYSCEMEFTLPTSEASAFAELFESTYRGVEVSLAVLLGGAYPNFHPFGPHVDLSGNDTVKAVAYKDNGQVDPFGKFWAFSVIIHPVGPLAYYSQIVDCGAGGFRFGSLTNFYLPEVSPKIEYAVGQTRFGPNTYLHHNAEATQTKNTALSWEDMKTEGARNILIEVTQNIRVLQFTMNAGANRWPYSLRGGQGDKIVQLANAKIVYTNDIANLWSINVEVVNAE